MMRILLTGASGQLGAYLLRRLREADADVIAWSGRREGVLEGFPLHRVDLADDTAVRKAFAESSPDVVIHAAAVTSVAEAFRSPKHAEAVNVDGTARLAELAAGSNCRMVYVSTDLVFDGERVPCSRGGLQEFGSVETGGYREEDQPNPLSVYGRTKFDAERSVRDIPRGLVLRVPLLVGRSLIARPTLFDSQVDSLRAERPITLFDDEWRTPLSYQAAAEAILAAARSEQTGLLHVAGRERLSRFEMGSRLASAIDASPRLLIRSSRDSAMGDEPRPRDTSLDCGRFFDAFPECRQVGFDEILAANLAAAPQIPAAV